MEEVDLNDDGGGRRYPETQEGGVEDTPDPRIQVQLEQLNTSTDTINKLEVDLDESRMMFRQLLTESTHRIDTLAKRLGKCVEQSRPYYEARIHAKQALRETQGAAVRYERAMSQHNAAREMVLRTETGLMEKDCIFDDTWQEMLNHATTKVNYAETEKLESAAEHRRTSVLYHEAETRVKALQKELKRAIAKSSLNARRSLLQMNNLVRMHQLQLLPYFELKAAVNQQLEGQKREVRGLEESVAQAKLSYSDALCTLETISNEIHQNRQSQLDLGVRGIGVGAESPVPPTQTRDHCGGSGRVMPPVPCHYPQYPDAATQDYKSLPGHLGPSATPIMAAQSLEATASLYKTTVAPGVPTSADFPFVSPHYEARVTTERSGKSIEKSGEIIAKDRGRGDMAKIAGAQEKDIVTETRKEDRAVNQERRQTELSVTGETKTNGIKDNEKKIAVKNITMEKDISAETEDEAVRRTETPGREDNATETGTDPVMKDEGLVTDNRVAVEKDEGSVTDNRVAVEKDEGLTDERDAVERTQEAGGDVGIDEVDGAATDLTGWQVIGLGSPAMSAPQYLTVDDKDSAVSDTESLASIEMLSDDAIDGLMLDEELAEASHSICQTLATSMGEASLPSTPGQGVPYMFHNHMAFVGVSQESITGIIQGEAPYSSVCRSMSAIQLHPTTTTTTTTTRQFCPPHTLTLRRESSSEQSSLEDLTPGYAPLRDTPYSPQDFHPSTQTVSSSSEEPHEPHTSTWKLEDASKPH